MDFAQVAELCAPNVASSTLRNVASVESGFNPFAIGVVGGRLVRQPKNLVEAVATAEALKAAGWNYSLGLIQVNQKNFPKYGLSNETAFDPCSNLRAGSQILVDCYRRAGGSVTRTGDALSCYYTGDLQRGYRLGYVAKVQGVAVTSASKAIPVIATARVMAPKPGKRPPSNVSSAAQIASSDPSLTPKRSSTALLF